MYMAKKTIISIWNSIPLQLVKKKDHVLVHPFLGICGFGGGVGRRGGEKWIGKGKERRNRTAVDEK